jgi:hypothetical protein
MAMVRYDQDEIDDGYSDDGKDTKKDAIKTYRAHGRPVGRRRLPWSGEGEDAIS